MTWTTPARLTLQNSASVPQREVSEKTAAVTAYRQAKDLNSRPLEHHDMGIALHSLSRKLLTLNALVIEECELATSPHDTRQDYKKHLRNCVLGLLKLCISEIVAISKMPHSQLPEITQEVLNDYDPPRYDYTSTNHSEEVLLARSLSPRELQVVRLLAQGKCNKEIASTLNLSTKTVATYRERIMLKLNTHSIADLFRFAIHHKLASL